MNIKEWRTHFWLSISKNGQRTTKMLLWFGEMLRFFGCFKFKATTQQQLSGGVFDNIWDDVSGLRQWWWNQSDKEMEESEKKERKWAPQIKGKIVKKMVNIDN